MTEAFIPISGAQDAEKLRTDAETVNGNLVHSQVVKVSGTVPISGSFTQVALDANNSTTTPLLANATYTGTATDVSAYQAIILQAYSDKGSAANGIKIQSSTDGTNWDHEHTYTLTAGESTHLEETLSARYFRIQYVNGNQAQTVFRLQVKLLTTAATAHVHPVVHELSDNHPAQVVRAIISGRSSSGGGEYVNVKVNPSGTLAIGNDSIGTTGSAAPASATLIGGTDGTNLRAASVDTSGRQVVIDPTLKAVGDQKLFHVGGTLTSGIASTQSYRFENPAASGKTLTITRLILGTTRTTSWAMNKDGTLGAPTSRTPYNANFSGSDTTVAVVQQQTAAPSGGTTLSTALFSPADIPLDIEIAIVLPAGTAITISATFTVGATSYANVAYTEY